MRSPPGQKWAGPIRRAHDPVRLAGSPVNARHRRTDCIARFYTDPAPGMAALGHLARDASGERHVLVLARVLSARPRRLLLAAPSLVAPDRLEWPSTPLGTGRGPRIRDRRRAEPSALLSPHHGRSADAAGRGR